MTSLTWDEPTSSWQVGIREPGRDRGGPRGAVRHQRGRFAEHPAAARHPRHGLVRRAVVPLGALARRARPRRASGSRSSAPAPPGSRSRRPSRTRSSSSRSSSGRPSGCCRTRCTTRRCRPVTGGRCSTSRSTHAGSGSSCSIPASRWAPSTTASIRSSAPSEGVAINEANDLRRQQLTAWITMHLEDRPDLIEKSIPDYPAMGKRILQDNGSWLRTLKKPNVELVHTAHRAHRPRGCGHRRRRAARSRRHLLRDRVPAQRLPRVDGASPGATACRCATSGATSRPRTSGSRSRTSRTSSACTARARTSRTVRACSSTPSARSTTRWTASTGSWRPVRGRSRCARTRTTSTSSATAREIDQLVWSHPSIEHSHYKNPQGKIFTLSPWPLELYWEWTRRPTPRSTRQLNPRHRFRDGPRRRRFPRRPP